MEKYKSNFEADKYYHVFNRAVGDDKLFRSEENYRYFKEKISKYILPIADCWAYALLPNHFHFLLKIKEEKTLKHQAAILQSTKENHHEFILQQFSNFQNAYAKAFNKMFQRKGSLFIERINRIELSKDDDLAATIFYIHKNPVHHFVASSLQDWVHCSYKDYLNGNKSILDSKSTLNFFGGKDAFVTFHEQELLK